MGVIGPVHLKINQTKNVKTIIDSKQIYKIILVNLTGLDF